MNVGNIDYLNLESLAHTDYKISDGQANILGWKVNDRNGNDIGKIIDLLFDPEQNVIRYAVLEVNEEIQGNINRQVLIPMEVVRLKDDERVVTIPAMSPGQYELMPPYIIGEVTRDMETFLRTAFVDNGISSPERANGNADHQKGHGYEPAGYGSAPSGTGVVPEVKPGIIDAGGERTVEQQTIHRLVENADVQKFPVEQEPGNHATSDFIIETAQGSYTIQPQANGTYRIMRDGEKFGVLYAEAAENEGVKWQTMDDISEELLNDIGTAITNHNTSQKHL